MQLHKHRLLSLIFFCFDRFVILFLLLPMVGAMAAEIPFDEWPFNQNVSGETTALFGAIVLLLPHFLLLPY